MARYTIYVFSSRDKAKESEQNQSPVESAREGQDYIVYRANGDDKIFNIFAEMEDSKFFDDSARADGAPSSVEFESEEYNRDQVRSDRAITLGSVGNARGVLL